MDGQRIRELSAREAERFAARTPASRAMFERAQRTLAGGVSSSFHGREPWPVYLARGEGARVWDADGNEYVDFHNGFSAMVQGHAHPAVVAAVRERAALGTHFGATTEDAVAVAEELRRRFGLPRWRFTNSGTEANMAAIRLARASTGREAVVQMAGAYHGHAEITHLHEVPFNDVAALERLIAEVEPACVITEGAMTSVGLVLPEPGYLDALRDLTRRHGVVLILDEVKTGLTIAAGGAVERLGAQPGHGDARQIARRRAAHGRGGHDRGAGRACRGRAPAAARHLQRQPALDGCRGGEPAARCSRRPRTPSWTGSATGW